MSRKHWLLLPGVDAEGAYDEATDAERRWCGQLARLLARKPDTLELFFRTGFRSVVAEVMLTRLANDEDHRRHGESGTEMSARSVASIAIPGADCGDP